MAQPQIYINDNQEKFPIWDSTDAKQLLGYLYPKELFVDTYGYSGTKTPHYAYTSAKGWTKCWIPTGEYGALLAFGTQFDYGYSACGETVQGYVFKVRSACRVFEGTTFITRLYAGDIVYTDGKSHAGLSYPYRLSIKGYKKSNGECKWLKNGFCDTDMEIGRTMYNETCVYGAW